MANTTNTTPRITKADNFNKLLTISAVKADPQLVKFIEHELELLSKKNSAEKKPTAQQTANEGIKTAIIEHLGKEPNRLFTISEIIKETPACEGMANQKISALVSQLSKSGKVKRTEDKRKAYFQYAPSVEVEDEEEA